VPRASEEKKRRRKKPPFFHFFPGRGLGVWGLAHITEMGNRWPSRLRVGATPSFFLPLIWAKFFPAALPCGLLSTSLLLGREPVREREPEGGPGPRPMQVRAVRPVRPVQAVQALEAVKPVVLFWYSQVEATLQLLCVVHDASPVFQSWS
jgi:hypothetical protein